MFNCCIISGHVLEEPQCEVEDNELLVTFKLALWKDQRRAGWIRVFCYYNLAEKACKSLSIGTRVFVAGLISAIFWHAENGVRFDEDVLLALELELLEPMSQIILEESFGDDHGFPLR
jgi:single-stranded DNA-binding protein